MAFVDVCKGGSRANGQSDTVVKFRSGSRLLPEGRRFGPAEVIALITLAASTLAHVPFREALHGARKYVTYWSSCDERRLGQWDPLSWNDFLRATDMSPSMWTTARFKERHQPATGVIRILEERCTTCVLNPARTAIPLPLGRRREFVNEARAD